MLSQPLKEEVIAGLAVAARVRVARANAVSLVDTNTQHGAATTTLTSTGAAGAVDRRVRVHQTRRAHRAAGYARNHVADFTTLEMDNDGVSNAAITSNPMQHARVPNMSVSCPQGHTVTVNST
jgi:hypothetical protein